MKDYTVDNIQVREYDSVAELFYRITNDPVNPVWHGHQNSNEIGNYSFRGTNSFEEAADLLLHGWTVKAVELERELEKIKVDLPERKSSKSVYNVVGGNASVPRYLQGIPTSMIERKPVMVKERVVVVNKSMSYSADVSKEQIQQESIKALQIVKMIEATGAKVRLNVIWGLRGRVENHVFKVCLKRPDERLNISKMSFPLVHPSMLRRIGFRMLETSRVGDDSYRMTYGWPCDDNSKKVCGDKEKFIPAILRGTAEEYIKRGETI
jgi:hypothetical protein